MYVMISSVSNPSVSFIYGLTGWLNSTKFVIFFIDYSWSRARMVTCYNDVRVVAVLRTHYNSVHLDTTYTFTWLAAFCEFNMDPLSVPPTDEGGASQDCQTLRQERKRACRQQETEEQREERLRTRRQREQARTSARRSEETEEQREERLRTRRQREQARTSARRSEETEEQREERLRTWRQREQARNSALRR